MATLLETNILESLRIGLGLSAGTALIALLGLAHLRKSFSRVFGNMPPGKKEGIAFGVMGICSLGLMILPQLRHAAFQSRAFDLGEFSNVMWNVLHGNGFYDALYPIPSLLGQHWEPILAPLSLLLLIHEDASTVLLIQGIALSLGGWGVYALARRLRMGPGWSLALALLYFYSPHLHRLNRADFHAECLASPLILWGLVAFQAGRRNLAFLAFAALWFVKQDLIFVSVLIGLYLALVDRRHRKASLAFAAMSAAVFLVVVKVLMPSFKGEELWIPFARYAHLGQSWGEILRTMLTHPFQVAMDHLSPPPAWKTAAKLLLPFLGLPLLGGRALLLPMGAWSIHLLTNYPTQRGLLEQYSAAVLPLTAYSACLGMHRLLCARDGLLGSVRAVLETATPAAMILFVTGAWGMLTEPYFTPADGAYRRAAVRMVDSVPSGVSLSAQSGLAPHLAMRKDIRLFPKTSGLDYIILDRNPKSDIWPVKTRQEYDAVVRGLLEGEEFELIGQEHDILLLRRKQAAALPRGE